ncbi:hypothetical protein B0O99DRAFT_609420 [Bisporella sp. PMI_857]|nr:hypothetical protein B0O99DRAFT_609420 [Bisporella sp. PMI_857]
MSPLKSGTCATCSKEDVKLRPNPFTKEEECEDCRKSGKDAIIGITDIKNQFGLKEADLEGLQMVKEAKPAFVGGPDYRWYKLKDIEVRAPEAKKKLEEEARAKEAEKKEKEEDKEAARIAKEEDKKAKAEEREKKAATKEAEKQAKAEERKRKREEKEAAKPKKEKAVPTRSNPSRGAGARKSLAEDADEDDGKKPVKKRG